MFSLVGSFSRHVCRRSIVLSFVNRGCWLSGNPSIAEVRCWDCERLLNNVLQDTPLQFFCDCEKTVVLPPSGKDYFRILGCERSFHIDASKLKKSFLQLQALLHPDKYTTNKSLEEQRNSADQSAVVNRAYSTLRKPYSRAKYLLSIEDVEVKSSHGGELDHDFLLQIMEENETIEETDDLSVLNEIEERNLGIIEKLEEEMAYAFSSKSFEVAGDILAKMKYYQTILDNVAAKLNKN